MNISMRNNNKIALLVWLTIVISKSAIAQTEPIDFFETGRGALRLQSGAFSKTAPINGRIEYTLPPYYIGDSLRLINDTLLVIGNDTVPLPQTVIRNENHAKILYVTKSGDDGTAIPGDGHAPYNTIAGAVAAANDGDIIKLLGNIRENKVVVDKQLTFELNDGNWYADETPVLTSTSKYCGIRNGKVIVENGGKDPAITFEVVDLSNVQIYCLQIIASGQSASSVMTTQNVVMQTDSAQPPVVSCNIYNNGYFVTNSSLTTATPPVPAVVFVQGVTVDSNVFVAYPPN